MPTAVITDHVFASPDIEREMLGAIDATIVPLQARAEGDLVDAVPGADALLVCYAPITAGVIERMPPRLAFYSEDSVRELQRKATEDVVRVLSGQTPRSPVSAPGSVPR